MREILFRGKRTDNGKWEYGSLLSPNEFNEIPHIVYIDYLNEYGEIGEISTPVIPETVGQYTGLTDKNGVRIFEGDIVRYGDTIHRAVFEQRNGTAYFGLVYSSFETLPFGHYQDLKQIEVIGNIHDNPELLETAAKPAAKNIAQSTLAPATENFELMEG